MLLSERQQYNNMDHCHLRPVDVSAPIICKADFEKHAYVCLVGGDFRLLLLTKGRKEGIGFNVAFNSLGHIATR